ncbi:MAG: hypothetical protein HQK77_21350, partial [Desulfobacterales bacterium]|nr:hypothetical protein [Desulfobacterales bacterium]
VVPDFILKIILEFNESEFLTKANIFKSLQELNRTNSLNGTGKNLKFCCGLQLLLLNNENSYQLTPLGLKIKKLINSNKALLGDIIHFLIFSLYTFNPKPNLVYSYSYRVCSALLYSNIEKSSIKNTDILGELIDEISKKLDIETIPIDSNFISTCISWLLILSPPFIFLEDGKRTRKKLQYREYCSPELILLVIDLYYRENNLKPNHNIIMDEELTVAICKAALIHKDIVYSMIKTTSASFPEYLETKTSTHGYLICLKKLVNVEDII